MNIRGKIEDASDVKRLFEEIEGFIDGLIAKRDMFAERVTEEEAYAEALTERIEELKAELATERGQ